MGVKWTDERREKFQATVAAKKERHLLALSPEEKKDKKRRADREYHSRKKAETKSRLETVFSAIPVGAVPSHPIKLFCMRCGYPMEIIQPL